MEKVVTNLKGLMTRGLQPHAWWVYYRQCQKSTTDEGRIGVGIIILLRRVFMTLGILIQTSVSCYV